MSTGWNRAFRGIKRKLVDTAFCVFDKPTKERKITNREEDIAGGSHVDHGRSLIEPLVEPDSSNFEEDLRASAPTEANTRERNFKERGVSDSQWRPLAVDLVMCDRTLQKTVANQRKLREQKEAEDEWRESYRPVFFRPHAHENADRDAYIHDLAQDDVDGTGDHIRELDAQLNDNDREVADQRIHCINLSDRLVTRILAEESDARSFYRLFTIEVLNALTALLEVKAQIEEELSMKFTVEDRGSSLQRRIHGLKTQIALDKQLGQTTLDYEEIVDKKVARCKGALTQLQLRVGYHEQTLKELKSDRGEAADAFCDAIEDILISSSLIEPAENDHQDQDAPDHDEVPFWDERALDARGDGGNRDERDFLNRAHQDGQDGQGRLERSNLSDIDRHHRAKHIARQGLQEAIRRHDELNNGYEQDLHMFTIFIHPNRTRSDFDRTHLRSRMVWSGRIVAAEKALQDAREALANAGIPASPYAEAKFPDRWNDGYAESFDEGLKRRVDRPKLERWLDEMDETETPREGTERRPKDVKWISYSERNNLVAIGDSVSCIADEFYERKIKKWEGLKEWEDEGVRTMTRTRRRSM